MNLGLNSAAAAKASGPDELYAQKLTTIEGKPTTLAPYKGKALLIVNTASRCGFTPQLKGLEALYAKYKARGLVVLGFPSNDFGGQEPGSNEEIGTFCRTEYGIKFPLFAKAPVVGKEQQPVFAYLSSHAPVTGPVKWNFEKFVVARDGRIVARFDSKVKPEDPAITSAIESSLE